MSKVNEFRMSVQNILIMLLNNMGMDTPQNIEEITDFVAEDVMETADPIDWHSGDVAIAFRRWVEHQSETDIDKDEDGNCLYCGQKCFRGEMCDEQQAGGFTPKSAPDVSLGKTLYNIGELRYLLEGLDDHDQICVETCDENGDVCDLYPMSLDVIDGIRLTDGTEVREVRFCQRPHENVPKDDLTECIKSGQHLKSCDADGFCNNCGHQETVEDNLIDAVIDDLKKSMALGDYTVLDELLRFIPRENLIGALPEELWKDFN